MLPYSPLHHLLLADAGDAARDDERQRLRRADRVRGRRRARAAGAASPTPFLLHDRPIQTRTDDSVVRAVARGARCCCGARAGYVPGALRAAGRGAPPLLACGAELKSTFCVAKGAPRVGRPPHRRPAQLRRRCAPSPTGIAHFERLFAVAPEVVAHDLHPDYLSTELRARARGRRARRRPAPPRAPRGVPGRARRDGPAVGAIYDGTGYGTDGTVWGGELLVGDLRGLRARRRTCGRCGMPGGDARRPRAVADGLRVAGRGAAASAPPAAAGDRRRRAGARSPSWRGAGWPSPLTTSMGRLFDAVAALCGLRARGHLRGPGGDRARGGRATREEHGRLPAAMARRWCSTRARRSRAVARRPRARASTSAWSPPASTTPSPRRRPQALRRGRRRARARDRGALRRRVPEPRGCSSAPRALLERARPARARARSACRPTTAGSPSARRPWPRPGWRCSARRRGDERDELVDQRSRGPDGEAHHVPRARRRCRIDRDHAEQAGRRVSAATASRDTNETPEAGRGPPGGSRRWSRR